MSSSLQVSRRTVARGAAWSVPIVAVGVAAPAFAASPAGTPIASADGSCKCPGAGANNFNFKTLIAFSTPGSDDWKIHVNSFTFDNTNETTLPADITLTGGEGNLLLVTNKSNSQSKHTVLVTYTATNLATSQTIQGSFGPIELTYPPQCELPITCP